MTVIDLPLYVNATLSRSTIVVARIVDIAPHLAHVATFAVHEDVLGRGGIGHQGHRVTNVETGCAIGGGAYFESNAIEDASDRLKCKTVADLLLAYEKAPAGCRE